MTPAEQYAIIFTAAEPNNYTVIPNIIDELTYDEIDEKTGVSVIKRLSVFAIQLYRIIRRIAGDSGACWRTALDLAEIANMSEGQVSKCKKELQNKFHQLDGNPLIIITEKDKTTFKDRQKTNGTIYHVITITNIWGYNGGHFFNKKINKQNQASSPNDPAEPASSPQKPAPQRASSPGDPNNNICINNPLSKEQQPAGAPVPVCSSNKKVNSVPTDPPEILDKKAKAFSWFIKIGCDIQAATRFTESYSVEEIQQASLYVKKQLEKKKSKSQTIVNIIGYISRVLENKWWLSAKHA